MLLCYTWDLIFTTAFGNVINLPATVIYLSIFLNYGFHIKFPQRSYQDGLESVGSNVGDGERQFGIQLVVFFAVFVMTPCL